jgi:uncharacterized protein (UPF0210 family)
MPLKDLPLQEVAEIIKKLSFKLSRAGELVGAKPRAGWEFRLASSICRSRRRRFPAIQSRTSSKAMGFERAGTHGTTAALALLTDAVKKGGAMASNQSAE